MTSGQRGTREKGVADSERERGLGGSGHEVDFGSPSALVAYVALGAVILFALGHPVPYNNEHVHLIQQYRVFHPDFASSEWSFARPQYAHFVLQMIAGTLMKVLPLEVVGWLLRLVSWTGAVTSIVLIGSVIGLRPWMTAVAIGIWIADGQTILAGDAVLRSADAKAMAFPLLFFAIHSLLTGREYRAAILIGLGVSIHPLLGVKLGGAICAGALFLRSESWRLVPFAGLVVLFSLPGVIPLLYGMSGGQPLTVADWEFIARFAWPEHLNPTSFALRRYLVLGLLTCFNLLICWKFWRERPYRLLGVVQAMLGLLFVGGLLAWGMGAYPFLQLMPFRVFPVLVPLFFLLFVADLVRRRQRSPVLWVLAAWGLLAFREPVAGLVDLRFGQNESLSRMGAAFGWIARETPDDAIILSPPSAVNAISASGRGQVSYARAVHLWALDEWRERLDAVVGPLDDPSSVVGPTRMLARYDALTIERVRAIRERYGATHFVTRVGYDLPMLYEAQGWRIYSLAGLAAP